MLRGYRGKMCPLGRAEATPLQRRDSNVNRPLGGGLRCKMVSFNFGDETMTTTTDANNRMNRPLDTVDPAIAELLRDEARRQATGLELIPSENLVSEAVLEAMGSIFTNKYAEGYPGKRYYGGCEYADKVEQLAIDRAKELFGAEHANVQAHSGTSANVAVYMATLKPGDTVLGMNLAHGGHLTHGHPLNFSGRMYKFVAYGVRQEDERIDYDEIEKLAHEHKPRMIVAGASAYSRVIDFERIGKVAKAVDALFFVDMAHIAGLVAAGVHPSPVPHADIVSTTTHKTLRGPRAGMVLCRAGICEGDRPADVSGDAGRAAGAHDCGESGVLCGGQGGFVPRVSEAGGSKCAGPGGSDRQAGISDRYRGNGQSPVFDRAALARVDWGGCGKGAGPGRDYGEQERDSV